MPLPSLFADFGRPFGLVCFFFLSFGGFLSLEDLISDEFLSVFKGARVRFAAAVFVGGRERERELER